MIDYMDARREAVRVASAFGVLRYDDLLALGSTKRDRQIRRAVMVELRRSGCSIQLIARVLRRAKSTICEALHRPQATPRRRSGTRTIIVPS